MTGPSILLVEDEAIIAMDIEMTLQDNGYTVIGPFKSEAQALGALADRVPAVAVLDINLGTTETSFGIARRMVELGTPIVFLTGYTTATVNIPDDIADAGRLLKPISDLDLLTAVAKALAD